MEVAHKHALYDTPHHPYAQALLSAIPVPDPRIERGKTLNQPSVCVFRTRCPKAMAQCAQAIPPLRTVAAQTQSACILD